MIESDEQLQKLVEQAEQRERRARRNALLYTLIPILVVIGLLWFTGWQVQKASQELADSQAALARTTQTLSAAEFALRKAQDDLGTAETNYAAVNQRLAENSRILTDTLATVTQVSDDLTDLNTDYDKKKQELNDLQNEVNEINNWLETFPVLSKEYKSNYYTGDILELRKFTEELNLRPGVLDLFDRIIANLDVPWKINGRSFEEGMNSPTYAAMLLGLISQPVSLSIDQETLKQLLPLLNEQPQIGDVVYYGAGMTCFYFEDFTGQRVVIGMSPVGVVALNYDFAEPMGIGVPFR
jgi:hypothetical protein